jgi:hypothetical protein
VKLFDSCGLYWLMYRDKTSRKKDSRDCVSAAADRCVWDGVIECSLVLVSVLAPLVVCVVELLQRVNGCMAG